MLFSFFTASLTIETHHFNGGICAGQVASILNDYPNALARAVALDNKIVNAAGAVSTHYADLVSLAARQAMASTEITVGSNGGGSFDISDVKMFMKNIGQTNTAGVFNSFVFMFWI